MDSGFYSSFAGFAARMDALDVVANNLANTNTVGYKAHLEFYRSYAAALGNGSPVVLAGGLSQTLNQSINQFGILGGSRMDMSQGTFERTGNDTDVALEGAGFFTVLTNNGVRYTRNGSFRLDKSRQLVTEQGDPVLSQQPNQQNKPIQVPTGQVSISADGSISVDGALVAKLRIEDFSKGTQMLPEGRTYLAAPAGAASIVPSATVRQGMLESSNSDPVHSTVALIDLQRTAQIMEKALSIFHNEFNRTAAQDLPRV